MAVPITREQAFDYINDVVKIYPIEEALDENKTSGRKDRQLRKDLLDFLLSKIAATSSNVIFFADDANATGLAKLQALDISDAAVHASSSKLYVVVSGAKLKPRIYLLKRDTIEASTGDGNIINVGNHTYYNHDVDLSDFASKSFNNTFTADNTFSKPLISSDTNQNFAIVRKAGYGEVKLFFENNYLSADNQSAERRIRFSLQKNHLLFEDDANKGFQVSNLHSATANTSYEGTDPTKGSAIVRFKAGKDAATNTVNVDKSFLFEGEETPQTYFFRDKENQTVAFLSDIEESAATGSSVTYVNDIAALQAVATTDAGYNAENLYYVLNGTFKGPYRIVSGSAAATDTKDYLTVKPASGNSFHRLGNFSSNYIPGATHTFSNFTERNDHYTANPQLKRAGMLNSILDMAQIASTQEAAKTYSSGSIKVDNKIYVTFLEEDVISVYNATTFAKIKDISSPHGYPNRIYYFLNKLYVVLENHSGTSSYLWILDPANNETQLSLVSLGITSATMALYAQGFVFVFSGNAGFARVDVETYAVSTYGIGGVTYDGAVLYDNGNVIIKPNYGAVNGIYYVSVIASLAFGPTELDSTMNLPTGYLGSHVLTYLNKAFVIGNTGTAADRGIYVYSMDDYLLKKKIACPHTETISAFLSGSRMVFHYAFGSNSQGAVVIVDPETEEIVKEIQVPFGSSVKHFSVGKILVTTGGTTRTLRIIDIATSAAVNVIATRPAPYSPYIYSTLLLPENKVMLVETGSPISLGSYVSFYRLTATGVQRLAADSITWEDFPKLVIEDIPEETQLALQTAQNALASADAAGTLASSAQADATNALAAAQAAFDEAEAASQVATAANTTATNADAIASQVQQEAVKLIVQQTATPETVLNGSLWFGYDLSLAPATAVIFPRLGKGAIGSIDPANIADTTAIIPFSAIPGQEGYRMQLAEDSNFTKIYPDFETINISANATSFQLTELTASTTYHVRYKAYRAELYALEGFIAPWSAGKSFTTAATDSGGGTTSTPESVIALNPPKVQYNFNGISPDPNVGSLSDGDLNYHTSGVTGGGSLMASQPNDGSRIFDGVKTSAGGFAYSDFATPFTIQNTDGSNTWYEFTWVFKSSAPQSVVGSDNFIFAMVHLVSGVAQTCYITAKHDESIAGRLKIESRFDEGTGARMLFNRVPPSGLNRTSFFDNQLNVITVKGNATKKWEFCNGLDLAGTAGFDLVLGKSTFTRVIFGMSRNIATDALKGQCQHGLFYINFGTESNVRTNQQIVDLHNQILATS